MLSKPDDRFQGFARLLGLEVLDKIHKSIISLCTAPENRLPLEIKELQVRINSLETRINNRPALASLQKVFKNKSSSIEELTEAILGESRKRLPVDTPEDAILPQLLKIREDSVDKVYKGRITLPGFTDEEKFQNSENENFLFRVIPKLLPQNITN